MTSPKLYVAQWFLNWSVDPTLGHKTSSGGVLGVSPDVNLRSVMVAYGTAKDCLVVMPF